MILLYLPKRFTYIIQLLTEKQNNTILSKLPTKTQTQNIWIHLNLLLFNSQKENIVIHLDWSTVIPQVSQTRPCQTLLRSSERTHSPYYIIITSQTVYQVISKPILSVFKSCHISRHSYLVKYVFRNQTHQNQEHSIIFRNTIRIRKWFVSKAQKYVQAEYIL